MPSTSGFNGHFNATSRRYDFDGEQQVAIGAASLQSVVFDTDEVCLNPTVDCFVKIAADPTAVAEEGMFLAAGDKFHVQVGDDEKVAVIQADAGGVLLVLPVA